MVHKPNIVIVGGGVAGLETATLLGNNLGKKEKANITLIDKDSIHIWKPILHTIAAGTNDLYTQQVYFVAHAHQHHFTYWPGEMCGLDRQAKQIILAPIKMEDGTVVVDTQYIHYDVLIIAVGSYANDFGVPGVSQYCFFIDARLEAQAFHRHLQLQLLGCIAKKSGLVISVVGGGATGVELVAELVQFIEATENYIHEKINERIKINLIESGDRLLPAFPEKISTNVKKHLTKLGITIFTNTQVVAAEKDGYQLADGQFIPSNIMVWAAGVKAPNFLKHLDHLETKKNNMLCVKPTLQTTLDNCIFALGDCAYIENAGLPPTAQVAHQQAKFLVKQIPRFLAGKPLSPFIYHHLGGVVSLGKYSAYGSLGKYGIFPGTFIRGKIAQITYDFIYRNYQKNLHGWIKGYLLWLAEHINKLIHPPIRLD